MPRSPPPSPPLPSLPSVSARTGASTRTASRIVFSAVGLPLFSLSFRARSGVSRRRSGSPPSFVAMELRACPGGGQA